jgi:hypothetical protein
MDLNCANLLNEIESQESNATQVAANHRTAYASKPYLVLSSSTRATYFVCASSGVSLSSVATLLQALYFALPYDVILVSYGNPCSLNKALPSGQILPACRRSQMQDLGYLA